MRNLFLIIIIILSFVSCRKIKKTSHNENTLHVALGNKIPTFDPALSYDTVSATVVYQCYETLYEYHYLKRPYSIKPLLAEELPKIVKNNTRYIIKIRKNIRYHDDPAFNGKIRFVKAQDFITQIKRLAFIPVKSNGWWLFDNKIKGLNKFRKKAGNNIEKFHNLTVSGLNAPDDHTLVIDLLEPYPQMLFSLAMTFTSPIPSEIIKYYNNNLENHIIGTGPFKLHGWTKNKKILKLVKFHHYHESFYPGQGDRKSIEMGILKSAGQKLPFLDAVHFHILQKTQLRWKKFLSRDLDFLLLPKDYFDNAINSKGELADNLKQKNIHLQSAPTLTYWWLSFNMNNPLFGKNKYLRFAIAHAIDMDDYIKKFTNNIGLKANSIYLPGISGYNPSNQLPYKFDIQKAKEYMVKAGYPDGKNLPPITFDVRGINTTAKEQASFISKALSKINIRVLISHNTFPEFIRKSQIGSLQFWQDGWNMDYPDAENVLQLLISKNHPPGPNSTFYSNKKFDQLFSEMKVVQNSDEKTKLMQKMEDLIHEDLPWIMQYYARNYILIHDYLKNYRHSDLISNNMKYLKFER